jgi:predicted nucleotidyltransferase
MPTTTIQPPLSLDAVRAAVRAACAGRPVRCVEMFGSVARGESGASSDVDLLVDFLPEARVGLLELGALKEELEEKLGRPVDLLSRRAVERSANPYRRRAILAAPVTVYAR